MRMSKKLIPIAITLAIIISPVVYVIGRSTYWNRFIGSAHSPGCHGGGPTLSTTGYLQLTLNTSSYLYPNEIFNVTVQIQLFSEAANLHPEVIFNNNTVTTPSNYVRAESNNSLINILFPQYSPGPDAYYKPLLDAQGSYSGNDINFTLQAPSINDVYILKFDVIEGDRDTGSASGHPLLWVQGGITITVTNDKPPSISNVVALYDPLEGGNTQMVRANITDDIGVDTVQIMYDGTNHTMTYQSGNMWEYSSWTPTSIGTKIFTIYANDTSGQVSSVGSSFTVSDNFGPTITNIVNNASVIELGDYERIWVNVTDFSLPISSVLIEIAGSNYTMTYISGDMWGYSDWQPANVGTNDFKIWASDAVGNWNFAADSVTGQDTTPPTFSNLIESADPLPLGQNETIWIDVFDSPGSGVAFVNLFYDGLNHTMQQVGNTWSWSNWKPVTINTFPYTIYMVDNQNNVATVSDSITTEVGLGPVISNVTKIPEPLELGQAGYVSVNVTDPLGVSWVYIEFDGVNHTMTQIGATDFYEYSGWTPTATGFIPFKIHANNTSDIWSSLISTYEVVDTTAPTISTPWASAPTIELGLMETIQVNVTDFSAISQVKFEHDGLNYTMVFQSGDLYEYSWVPSPAGTKTYKIWASDTHGNWNSLSDSINVQDTTVPNIFGLTLSAPVLELGATETIYVNVTDLSPISAVQIEYAGLNHTMFLAAPGMYGYLWVTSAFGTNNFNIWAGDNQGNWNLTSGSISTIDTTPPLWSNFVNTPTVAVGSSVTISIDVTDSPGTGVATVLIEYDGTNHTMSQSGNTWSWNWSPTAVGNYHFTIYMIDGQNNVATTTGILQVTSSTSNNPTTPPLDLPFTIGMIAAVVAGILVVGVILWKPKNGKRGMRRLRIPLR